MVKVLTKEFVKLFSFKEPWGGCKVRASWSEDYKMESGGEIGNCKTSYIAYKVPFQLSIVVYMKNEEKRREKRRKERERILQSHVTTVSREAWSEDY
jgi:hypothetical protein